MTGVEDTAEAEEAAAVEAEVGFVVVFNFLEAGDDDDPPNEGEDFRAEDVLLTNGSSSSGSSWCLRLDLFLAEVGSEGEAVAAEASTLRCVAFGKEVSESVSDSDSTSSELLGLEGVFLCFFREVLVVLLVALLLLLSRS